MPETVSVKIISLTHEDAIDMAEELTEKTVSNPDAATTIYTGRHADHGLIHIVIPALGNPVLLPFAVRDF